MEQVFLKILNMSITAGYCALAVMVLRLFFKKQPKVYSYALWLIVAFRLICPVSFESVFSLMRVSTEAIPSNITVEEMPAVSTGNARVDMAVNRALAMVTPSTAEVVEEAAQTGASPMQMVLFVGSILWLVVAAVFFGYGIGSYMRMRRELSGATETEPGVFVSDCLKTPFVLGHFKPQIYLPEGLSSAEKAYVLEHERTHIRRGDHIIKMGAFFLMCVHWFNPVLWASFFLMCKDMEMSCDEKVVKKLSADHTLETKKDYASTLLALASNHQFSFGGPLAFGEGNIKKRINNVLQYKKRTVAVSVVLTIAVIVAALLLMGNPKDIEAGNVPGGVTATTAPIATATPSPTPVLPEETQTPTITPITDKAANPPATAYLERLMEKDGGVICYGIVRDNVVGNQYFSLELPEECVGKISYLAEIEEKEDGSKELKALHFYMTRESIDRAELLKVAMSGNLGNTRYWLDSYGWVELKDYLENGNFMDFELLKQEFVLVNEAGTGGMVESFPLDNTFSGEEAETFQRLAAMLSKELKIAFHELPQESYTEKELEKYRIWQQESLGSELMENVYYAEIQDRQIVTPYFELWVPEECVDKVSYLLKLQENADGTKAVSGLQFFYAAATKPREIFLTEPKAWSDYFVTSSWLGGMGWATIENYDVPNDILVDWVNRTGSVSINQLEPIYLAEAAPFGRELIWANAEETGAYFYYQPTDVQWMPEFEEEYLKLEGVLKRSVGITFFAEPDAISRDAFIEKLKGFVTE